MCAMRKTNTPVLVVDDDAGIIWTIGSALTRAGFAVTTCRDGAEALALLESRDFDILVTDVELQDINGLQLLDWARRNRPDLKVVVITGYGSGALKELAIGKGAFAYLEKPVDMQLLISVISEHDQKKAFSGSIDEIDIMDYVQLMLLSGRRVVVEVTSRDGRRGRLYIDKGSIIHAECGDVAGEDAVYECLGFVSGAFANLPWVEPRAATVNKPSEFLLIEAARKRDEMLDAQTRA
jgi:ActR/RegA family two-component response regulator